MAVSSVFVSHGAPTIALEKGPYSDALERFGRSLPAPRALIVFSGHFQAAAPIRIASARRPKTVHDFGGFSEELYAIEYPAPGDPALAETIHDRLASAGMPSVLDPTRGWDHGLWVPLRIAFPEAAIPVVEVSTPRGASPGDLRKIGASLGPLRGEGVVLVGSGGIVHNLARVRFGRPESDVDPWAKDFDDWVGNRLEATDRTTLNRYRSEGPHAELAVPTTEHFDPFFVALGYAPENARVIPIFEGFQHGNISLRSFALEA